MSFKTSRRNLIVFQNITILCAIFGIIPWYNFTQKKFSREKLFKYYLVLVALAIVALEAETIYRIYKMDQFDLVKLVAVAGEFMGLLIWATALYLASFKRDLWESLFTEIAELESVSNLNTPLKPETIFLKSADFQLCMTILLIIALFIYEILTFQGSKEGVFLFRSTYIYFFLHFLQSTIIGNMGLVLKNKFKDINDLLSSYEYETSVAIAKGTKKVKDLYSSMYGIVETFNSLFGPQLFLMGLHCSSQILQWSVTLVFNMFEENENSNMGYVKLMIGIIYIFLMLIWLGITTFCCDMAVVESEEIITICYRLQIKYTVFSEPYQCIKNLLYLVNNSKIKFTAMDYYEINRSTMFDLIGTTATYFVVLIQFSDRK